MTLVTDQGLRTPLFHKFSDSRTIQGILPFLDENDANSRSAAILTLRHSLDNSNVREAFTETLKEENDYGNQANLSEAIARISGELPEEEKLEAAFMLLERAYRRMDLL